MEAKIPPQRKRGRPKKGESVRFQALLLADQKERLEFLSGHLPGNPPLSGLLRDAVEEYLDRQFSSEVEKAYRDHEQKDLRIVR